MNPINLDGLQSRKPSVRMEALRTIGGGFLESQHGAVERELISLVTFDGNSVVRHEACFLLASLKQQGLIEGGLRAHAALLKAAADGSVLVRHEAALSLAAYPGPQTTIALEELSKDASADVAVSAALAIEELSIKGEI